MIIGILVVYTVLTVSLLTLLAICMPKENNGRTHYYSSPDDIRHAMYQAQVDYDFRWKDRDYHADSIHKDF